MKAHKSKFYRKGFEEQKRADIIFDMRRPESNVIKGWSLSERIMALAHLERLASKFEEWRKELETALK